MSAPLDVAAIRARADAATQGRWVIVSRGIHDEHDVEAPDSTSGLGGEIRGMFDRKADAEFIAHARADVPALCDEVERLREELRTTRDERDALLKAVGRVVLPGLNGDGCEAYPWVQTAVREIERLGGIAPEVTP